jgi:hypothetical protein
MTQVVGLKLDALRWLDENCVFETKERLCPHCCGVVSSESYIKKVPYDSAASFGMDNDGPTLYEYELGDGKHVYEKVQCVPWNSGPIFFLCLEIDGKKSFEWTDEESAEY